MEDSPAVRLEHRLTKIEQYQVHLATQVADMQKAIVQRLDYANGKMGEHFEADTKAFEKIEQWQASHDKAHAEGKGFKAGALWIMGGVVTAASAFGGLIVQVF